MQVGGGGGGGGGWNAQASLLPFLLGAQVYCLKSLFRIAPLPWVSLSVVIFDNYSLSVSCLCIISPSVACISVASKFSSVVPVAYRQ